MKHFILLIIFAMGISCSKQENDEEIKYEVIVPEAPIQKGDRRFNVAPSDGENGFPSTFESMKQVGVDLVELNLEWTYFEETDGEYKDPDGLLQAVGFYGDNNIDIAISLATINTVKRTDPQYLNSYNYDDPEYIESFTELIDWIMETIPQHVRVEYISLGNEIDYVLKSHEWQQFKSFMIEASNHIHTIYPEIKTGAKITITSGLLGNNQQSVLDIIEVSDIAMLNYYPSGDNFQVFTIDQVASQMSEVIELVDKPIYLTELGFQSGNKYCNSSEEKQAFFYHEFFKLWDKYSDEIKFVQINWMHDISDATLEFYGDYYGSSEPGFLEFLSTLGLKNYDESPKIAWDQIKVEANTRGWK